jgi:dienelactone hydrolase
MDARDPELGDPWAGFSRGTFAAGGIEHPVTRHVTLGRPVVILLHELQGLTPQAGAVARHLVEAGFSVTCPIMLPGGPRGVRQLVRNARAICVSAEFAALAARSDRPITAWIRSLAAHEATSSGHRVGVVGMCFSGGFALAAAVDPTIGAAVASQPAVPPPIPWRGHDLAMSAATFRALSDRAETGFSVCALRFAADPLSPRSRVRLVRSALPNSLVIEVPTRNPLRHSVLTSAVGAPSGSAPRQALDETVAYLHRHLTDETVEAGGRPKQ